jgi:hypothetical protein
MTSPKACTIEQRMTVEVDLTIDQLAEAIIHLSSDEQALLISRMAELAKFNVPVQLQYITDEECLTSNGRHLMSLIGDYARPTAELETQC